MKKKVKAKLSAKKLALKPIYTNIKIIDNDSVDSHDTRGEIDDYSGHLNEDHTHDIQGFKIVDDEESNDLVVPYIIDPKKSYYLLYVLHTDGDSFSHIEGLIEFIDMYESEQVAKDNALRIKKQHERYGKDRMTTDETYRVELENDKGGKYNISSSSWTGYFNRLSSVEVERIEVTAITSYE
jgi:hypothetical protein